jgi:hypothetical protein
LNKKAKKITILGLLIVACVGAFLLSALNLWAYADMGIGSNWILVYTSTLIISLGIFFWLAVLLLEAITEKIVPKRYIVYFLLLFILGVFLISR